MLFVICTHVRTLHLCYKKNALVFSQSEVQNECNEVVVKLYVVQFWSEIILLLISNRTSAARSFGFEITRKISDQIALHAVQLALPTRWIGQIINHVGLLSAMCTTIFSFCTLQKSGTFIYQFCSLVAWEQRQRSLSWMLSQILPHV